MQDYINMFSLLRHNCDKILSVSQGLTVDCLCVNAVPDLIYSECSLMSSVMT